MKNILAMVAAVLLLVLAGCGGGGDAVPPADGGGATERAAAVRCQATMANPLACAPKMTVALLNPAAAAVSKVTHRDPGTVRVMVVDGNGVGLRGVVVNLGTTDATVQPAAATTDGTGLARLPLPAGRQGGSFVARIDANAQGSLLSASLSYQVVLPQLSLELKNSAGRPLAQVTPSVDATLVATLKYPDGTPLANNLVTFGTNDSVDLVPASRTDLTNAQGMARVGLPAGPRNGGFAATAAASAYGIALSANLNYAVAYPVLAFDTPVLTPATLSAGGTASIRFTVTSGGRPYTQPLAVSFSSGCAALGKATITAQVATRTGVATATYADRGCAATDTITASVSLGGRSTTRSAPLQVLPATVGSIGFVSADSTNIALVGTGGPQRQEWSTLSFRVVDARGASVANVPVAFAFADSNTAGTVGGLRLQPAAGVTDATGQVSTTVSGGTIPTSVRVKASVGTITTLSSMLVVSSGVPDQQHFALSTSTGNCEGLSFDQECATVTALLADHFGNPVPDGTVVSFSTEGGAIDPFCLTGHTATGAGGRPGTCSVTLRSAQPKPANGRVTVLAYALGEEDFFDRNGNNRCDNCDRVSAAAPSEFLPGQDKSPDIWRDDNEDGRWTPGEPCLGPNRNGQCSTPGDGRYNGVLRSPTGPNSPAQVLYVSRQIVLIFAGSRAAIAGPLDPANGRPVALRCGPDTAVDLTFTVLDSNRNPMPAGTTVELTALFGVTRVEPLPASFTVASDPLGVGGVAAAEAMTYTTTLPCPNASVGRVYVKVTTPNRVVTQQTLYINR